eukprot:TRINITY_DN7441_c0_g1_i1.p2 TRINITY_DN7441_c0_g1~~TRINITY_DN7441_c0_g1_i1.p2  ORF type:complete len:107 (+),score=36.50 TRINITY_DN7441_c0_g1_i1:122-442(+)
MSSRYGILVTMQAKPGKISELLEVLNGHFVRQHDGREPGALRATIMEPTEAAPDTLKLFEQWDTKEAYEQHAAPNENLQVLFDAAGPLFASPPVAEPFSMQHFERE